MHTVVTSFNEEGFSRYGKDCIESFKKYWPDSVRLVVFYEGDEFPFTEGITWRPIEEVAHYKDFFDSLRFPIQHGIVGQKYDINFDARMGRKTLIQAHALDLYGGKVFWLDADSITHSPVPESFLDDCLPDDQFCCFLSRDGWYYTESGFIGFNADHPICWRFINSYVGIFMSGVFLTLPGWHDCFAFDAIRSITPEKHAFNNLAAGLPEGTMHPFVNSVLGTYMDHRKGKRKESRSTEKDLVAPRTEGYWNAKAE